MDTQDPHWIEITTFDDQGMDVEMDVNARPGSPWQYRHRQRSFTDEECFDWNPGQPQH